MNGTQAVQQKSRFTPPQPVNRKPLWRLETKERLDEIADLLADPDNTLVDIAAAYGVSKSSISTYAVHIGAPARKMGRKPGKAAQKNAVKPTHQLTTIERQIEAIAAKRRELDAELEKLKLVREELSIRFEWDGHDVLVYGIAAEPLKAPAAQWAQFLNLEGARKLREFIASKK